MIGFATTTVGAAGGGAGLCAWEAGISNPCHRALSPTRNAVDSAALMMNLDRRVIRFSMVVVVPRFFL
ncbi:hypothetical protein [Neorhizobium petrolearium]|uniref:hypothetical protein n=1 Tax=Neorhizobium petrolearium TaxID=515361 RepID=UPI003F17FAD7